MFYIIVLQVSYFFFPPFLASLSWNILESHRSECRPYSPPTDNIDRSGDLWPIYAIEASI